jgi:hypothetical protein
MTPLLFQITKRTVKDEVEEADHQFTEPLAID